MGFLISVLFLLPGLLRNRKPLTRLFFKTRDGKNFSLLVDDSQLTTAKAFFRQSNVPCSN
jgi:hypothetical protein